jgi:curved DNA-binding protein CbpA
MQSALKTGTKRTHYEILGIQTTATPKQIKVAYLKKAKLLHPDLYAAKKEQRLKELQNEDIASNMDQFDQSNIANESLQEWNNYEEEFKKVTEAYEVLSNVQERKKYDSNVLNLYDGAEYYFGKKRKQETPDNMWNRYTGTYKREQHADAIFIKNFKMEIDYRRRMRYARPEDMSNLQKMSRHFLSVNSLSDHQFTNPKIKGWSVASVQDARARKILFIQFLCFASAFVMLFIGVGLAHWKIKQIYGMPAEKYQSLLEDYYRKRAIEMGIPWDKTVLLDGLPDHKL